MSTLIVYADATNSGYVVAASSTYASCRSAASQDIFTPALNLASDVFLAFSGQNLDGAYVGAEGYLDFDTTLIGTVSAATLATADPNDGSTNFAGHSDTINARLYAYGTLTEADWLAGNATGKTLLAHIASGSLGSGSYVNWTDDAFPANVNTAGHTRVVLMNSRWEGNTAPTGHEDAAFAFPGDQSTDPKLTITYSVASGDMLDPMGVSGFFGA